jgi:hypothetical protein
MARLLVHVEGQTEETFVNEVLSDHLYGRGYTTVGARIIGNPRLRDRGGIRPWPGIKREIINHLRGDPACVATTMVDFYGMPKENDAAWPGRREASHINGASGKALSVERAMYDSVVAEMGHAFNHQRFVPFVAMHEFEGLLFSDCEAFARSIGQPQTQSRLKAIRDQFETPEDINDSPVTAPSKRIAAIVTGYEKPLFGKLATMEIGLAKMRTECPHFNHWLERLEAAVEGVQHIS